MVYFLISFFVFIILNWMIRQTNWYKNIFIDSMRFLSQISYNVKVVNLGSNQPNFAFDYKKNNINGMNLSVGTQTFEYDFEILKKYHKNLCSNATILIPICPFNFFLYRYSGYTNYIKYFSVLSSSSIHCYSFWIKLLHVYLPILTSMKNIFRLIKDSPLDTRLALNYNPMIDNEVGNDAKCWIDSWKRQFGIKSLNNIILSDQNKQDINKNIAILQSMILFCKENGYVPVLVTIPVSEQLRSLIPESFIEEYVVSKISDANSEGAKFLNYWNDSEFLNKDYYINSFFFNTKGREAFTKKVLSDLKLL